jgi:hypothetical protein
MIFQAAKWNPNVNKRANELTTPRKDDLTSPGILFAKNESETTRSACVAMINTPMTNFINGPLRSFSKKQARAADSRIPYAAIICRSKLILSLRKPKIKVVPMAIILATSESFAYLFTAFELYCCPSTLSWELSIQARQKAGSVK